MANNFQDTLTGKAELKDYYGAESQYEAIKKRRKKAIEKYGIEDEDKVGWDKTPKPIEDQE